MANSPRLWAVIYEEPEWIVGDTRWPLVDGYRLQSLHKTSKAAWKAAQALKPRRYRSVTVVGLSVDYLTSTPVCGCDRLIGTPFQHDADCSAGV